jgi:hypothetical protein
LQIANVSDIRRERRERRRAANAAGRQSYSPPVEPSAEKSQTGEPDADPGSPTVDAEVAVPAVSPRGPRAPRAARGAATRRGGEPGKNSASATAPAPVLLVDPSSSDRRVAKTAQRARRKQEMASSAVAGVEDNPALGALNRHLNMMMQQLSTAHRVIGRVAAERDALRQQLADLQGIPVEEIKVTTIGAAPAAELRPGDSASRAEPSRLQRLNFLGGDDIALVRRRRQMFVGTLILIGVVIAVAARQLQWGMPDDVSRNGLAALPHVGQFMTIFLAGWLLFRVVRVGSKGVRWVFPSEDRKRRRR